MVVFNNPDMRVCRMSVNLQSKEKTQALTYQGAHSVRVQSMSVPILHELDDILVRVAATAICGSDLLFIAARCRE